MINALVFLCTSDAFFAAMPGPHLLMNCSEIIIFSFQSTYNSCTYLQRTIDVRNSLTIQISLLQIHRVHKPIVINIEQ